MSSSVPAPTAADPSRLAPPAAAVGGAAPGTVAEAHDRPRLADALPLIVWLAAPDGRATFLNRQWAAYTGQDAAAGLAHGFDRYVHPDDLPAIGAAWRRRLPGGDAEGADFTFEYRLRRADGQYRWHLGRVVAERDAEGRLVGWVGTGTDIDDQKRAEAAADATRRDLARILAAAGEGILGIAADGTTSFVNPAAARLLGYTDAQAAAELVGRSQHASIHHHRPDGAPYAEAACPIYRALHTGAPCRVDDEVFWRRDGTPLPVEYTATPAVEGGRIVGAVLSFQDVTDRVRARRVLEEQGRELALSNQQLQEQAGELEAQAEELQVTAAHLEEQVEAAGRAIAARQEAEAALARQLAETEALYASAPVGLGVIDRELRFVRVNARLAEINGLPLEAHAGRPVREVVPDLAAQIEALWQRVLATGAPVPDVEVTGETPAAPGVRRVWREQWVPVRDAAGAVAGVQVVAEDVTEERRRAAVERVLADASAALAAVQDVDATLATLARMAVPTLADWCAIDVLDAGGAAADGSGAADGGELAGGRVRRVAVAHADPARTPAGYAFSERFPPRLDDPSGVGAVLRTGAPEFVPEITPAMVAAAVPDPERRAALEALGLRSALLVPITVRGRRYGVFTLVQAESGRRFGARDLALAEDLAARVGVAVENAELVAAERAARAAAEASGARLAAVLDALPDAAGVYDADWRFVYLNPAARALHAELLGPGARSTLGRVAWEVFPWLVGTKFESESKRAVAEGRPREYVEHVADLRRWYETRVIPLGPVGGELAGGAVSLNRDVTGQYTAHAERERLLAAERTARAEAEAARSAAEVANAAKGQFLANMSHELRTPLNAIGGYVQLLDMGLHGPVTEEQRAALARVQGAQTRLLALINDILNYAKLESGKVEYDVRAVDVREVVRDVAPLVEPQVRAKGLVFDVRLPAEPCVVWADREKLGQVLVNLLSNAIKFTESPNPETGAPGRVAVGVASRQGAPGALAFLRVEDTGVGVPRAKHESIFEPFVQVRSGYAQATEGTGLGLAISRDLARGMGGDLRVRSAPGEGSAFTVTLRRVVDADGHATDRRLLDERRDVDERREHEDRRRERGGGGTPPA